MIREDYHGNLREQLLTAKKYYQEDQYIKSLLILDRLVYTLNRPVIRQLRAKVRELVNDLQGSICDSECCDESPVNVLMQARLLAKLGFVEESVAKLRSLIRGMTAKEAEKWSILALGIAGRRFDLELLGVDKMDVKENLRRDFHLKGCAVEHLITLGQYDRCLKLFSDEKMSLISICQSLKSADLFYGNKESFSLEYIEKALSGIRGWLSLDEACLLSALASEVPAECNVVEIGSFQGRSTCALATGAKSTGKKSVHAVDNFSGLREIFPENTRPIFKKNITSKDLAEIVTVHQNSSLQEAGEWRRRDIGLLFIDADHNYESVKNDFNAWKKYLSPNGLIAFHDSNQKGPNKLLLEILNSKRVSVVTFRDSITVISLDSKIKDNFTFNPIWQAYLKTLGENYGYWEEAEKSKIKKSTLELFDVALCNLNSVRARRFNQRRITSVTDQSTTVVDVTYICNSHCRYCQWSNSKNPLKRHLHTAEILLSPKMINALGTKRIVLSGGEPRLHPKLPHIISYYRKIVNSVVLVTNGYDLNKQEVDTLVSHGLTGLAVSLDSMDYKESEMTRGTSLSSHQRLVNDLREIGEKRINLELGINCVVSSVTANRKTVRSLLEFGKEISADYVKFQPIFDDGYVEKHAPDLKLNSSNCSDLYKIAADLNRFDYPLTNPPEFWENIADLTMGKLLDPKACNQKENSIYVKNKLNVCYWLPSVSYSNEPKEVTAETIKAKRHRFEIAKVNCKVDYHCFCLQNLSHVWDNLGSVTNNEP